MRWGVRSHDPLPARRLRSASAAEDLQSQFREPVRDRGELSEQEAEGHGGRGQ